jgi:hypothetical protein
MFWDKVTGRGIGGKDRNLLKVGSSFNKIIEIGKI